MTPAVVVDVGNTRIKWGRCSPAGVVEATGLPPDDPAAWQRQAEAWALPHPADWALAGVHPVRCRTLAGWLAARGDRVAVLEDPARLPLRVLLERPDQVGIDRLLDAVAINARRTPGTPAVVVDAGSAVTVDLVDETGAFRGGAILPGLGLMARALHDHTALLPLIEPPRSPPPLPGTSTRAALGAGVFWAVAGGVRALVRELTAGFPTPPEVFLTGGDGPALLPALGPAVRFWATLTLDGVRLAAEALHESA